jgi:hypothetical protein
MLLELLISYLIYIYLIDTNILITLITYDGIISAINFFKFYSHDNSHNNIISQINKIHKSSIIDRYILFLIYSLFYIIAKLLFWKDNIEILKLTLIFCAVPKLINYIIINNSVITKIKQQIVKVLFSKFLTILVKKFSLAYLNKNVQVSYTEVTHLFDNYDKTVTYFSHILKNGLTILLFRSLKNYLTKYNYTIAKYFYNYKFGDVLKSFNEISAKNKLLVIVNGKIWEKLLEVDTFAAVYCLYESSNTEENDLLKNLIKNINYYIAKILALWSIASFFNDFRIILLINGFIYFVRNVYRRNFNLCAICKKIIIYFGTYYVGINYDSLLICSIISQFGKYLFDKKIVFFINKYIYFQINKLYKNIDHNIHLSNIIFSIILKLFIYNDVLFIYSLVQMYLLFIINYDDRLQYFINFSVTLLCYLSDFNIIHIFVTNIFGYLLYGVINNYKNNLYLPEKIIIEYDNNKIVFIEDNIDIIKNYY